MATPRLHPNGIGEALGDTLVTAEPLYTTGQIWYVHHTGDDANDGKNPQRPFATLGAAYNEAADADTIVLLDGHAETFTAALTVDKQLVIVGSGQISGKPTVKLANNSAAQNLFITDSTGIEFRNIWFEAQAQDNTAPLISDGSGARYIGCYFECGIHSLGPALEFNGAGTYCEVRSCTFVSTVTDPAVVPAAAIHVGTLAPQRILMHGVVLDGGQYGFENGYAYLETIATYVAIEQLSMLRGADMSLHTDTVVAYITPTTSTGNARIDFDGNGGG